MAATAETGDLLIATVSLIDPNFEHSVVLVGHHDGLHPVRSAAVGHLHL